MFLLGKFFDKTTKHDHHLGQYPESRVSSTQYIGLVGVLTIIGARKIRMQFRPEGGGGSWCQEQGACAEDRGFNCKFI